MLPFLLSLNAPRSASSSPRLLHLHQLEGRAINASLYALGEVVRCLVSGQKPPRITAADGGYSSQHAYVRWRDAKLTRMLQGPLGEDGGCVVLAHCRLER